MEETIICDRCKIVLNNEKYKFKKEDLCGKCYGSIIFDRISKNIVKADKKHLSSLKEKIGETEWKLFMNGVLKNGKFDILDVDVIFTLKQLFRRYLPSKYKEKFDEIRYTINGCNTGFSLFINDEIIGEMEYDDATGSFRFVEMIKDKPYNACMAQNLYSVEKNLYAMTLNLYNPLEDMTTFMEFNSYKPTESSNDCKTQ